MNEKRARLAWVLGVALAVTLGWCRPAQADDNYDLTVWFDTVFDEHGRVQSLKPQDEADHPPAFWEQMRVRVRDARIPPATDPQGRPATFRSGVGLRLAATKGEGGGSITVKGVVVAPMPLEKYVASYPKDIERTPGWDGAVTAVCRLGVEGRCTHIDIEALPGMPESVRRFARISMEGWRFQPQEVGGAPVEGQVVVPFRLRTDEVQPIDTRRARYIGGR